MAERIQVTPERVKSYIDENLSGDNYHLFYGLHLLSRERFSAVMDALLNGELQVEELVRLGGFSDAEADQLLAESLGSWVSPAVAIPAVGSDGYVYLTGTLGLGSMIRASELAEAGASIGRVLGASVRVGRGGHESIEAVEAIFTASILPAALDGRELRLYLPSSEYEVAELPILNSDLQRKQFLRDIASGILAPLMGSGSVLSKLLAVGSRRPGLSSAPGLAQWVLADPRPAGNTRLLVHREAALRTVRGAYTRTEIDEMLSGVLAARPGHIATGNLVSSLDFRTRLASAAAAFHFPSDAELALKASMAVDVMNAIYDHRDRLRGFILRVIDGCSGLLVGTYPAN